jgi:hypothetical protein
VNSKLYTGTVSHQRTRPVRNRFRYGVYYLYLDLAELETLDRELKRFGHNRRALVSLQDADHGPRDGTALRPWIDSLLAQVGIDLEGGRVCLLTFPRVLGFRFYPVSFWYCFHADGTPRAVLAEVQNTYRDRHNYLLHNRGAVFDWSTRPQATKAFFVSPFVQLEGVSYRFRFTEPAQSLSASIDVVADSEGLLNTTLSLDALPLTDAALTRAVVSMGPISVRALILIHWQALKLIAKGLKLVDHTPPPAEETSL